MSCDKIDFPVKEHKVKLIKPLNLGNALFHYIFSILVEGNAAQILFLLSWSCVTILIHRVIRVITIACNYSFIAWLIGIAYVILTAMAIHWISYHCPDRLTNWDFNARFCWATLHGGIAFPSLVRVWITPLKLASGAATVAWVKQNDHSDCLSIFQEWRWWPLGAQLQARSRGMDISIVLQYMWISI